MKQVYLFVPIIESENGYLRGKERRESTCGSSSRAPGVAVVRADE